MNLIATGGLDKAVISPIIFAVIQSIAATAAARTGAALS